MYVSNHWTWLPNLTIDRIIVIVSPLFCFGHLSYSKYYQHSAVAASLVCFKRNVQCLPLSPWFWQRWPADELFFPVFHRHVFLWKLDSYAQLCVLGCVMCVYVQNEMLQLIKKCTAEVRGYLQRSEVICSNSFWLL